MCTHQRKSMALNWKEYVISRLKQHDQKQQKSPVSRTFSMVTSEGLEPSTHWLRVSCSTNWAKKSFLRAKWLYDTIQRFARPNLQSFCLWSDWPVKGGSGQSFSSAEYKRNGSFRQPFADVPDTRMQKSSESTLYSSSGVILSALTAGQLTVVWFICFLFFPVHPAGCPYLENSRMQKQYCTLACTAIKQLLCMHVFFSVNVHISGERISI